MSENYPPKILYFSIIFWIASSGLFIYYNIFIGLIFAILFGILLFFFRQYIYLYFTSNWNYNKDWSSLIVEKIQITTPSNPRISEDKQDPIILHGKICKNIKFSNDKKPYIIFLHGLGWSMESMEIFSMPLALSGFHVLMYNLRGHGNKHTRSQGNAKDLVEHYYDIGSIIDFVEKRDDLLNNKIYVVGQSLGSIIALTSVYDDFRVRKIITLSGIHDLEKLLHKKYSFFSLEGIYYALIKRSMKLDYSDEEIHMLSPKNHLGKTNLNNRRLYMMHTKDDILPYSEFIQNQQLCKLPMENTHVFEKGGHGFGGQKLMILAKMIEWLNDT